VGEVTGDKLSDSSTVRRIQLGARLRELRVVKGLSREEAGFTIRASESKISRMELGRISFKERDIADLLTLYGVDDPIEQARLLTLARKANEPKWWHAYGDVLDSRFQNYLDLEQAAELIRTYEIQYVPGILQTEDYARAMIRLGHDTAGSEEIDRRTKLRMIRTELLNHPDSPHMWMVLDEAVLRRPVGGRDVLRRQIEALLESCQRPNVRIQVMPFDRGGRASGGSFSILRFPFEELSDVVYIEQLTSGLYLDKGEDVDRYAAAIGQLFVDAELPSRTPDILRSVLADLRNSSPSGVTHAQAERAGGAEGDLTEPARKTADPSREPRRVLAGRAPAQAPDGSEIGLAPGLRPHQSEALAAIEAAIAEGHSRMGVVLTPGSGRSTVIAHLLGLLLEEGHARRPLYLTSAAALAAQMAEVIRSRSLGEDGPLGRPFAVQLLTPDAVPSTEPGTITVASFSAFRALYESLPFDLVVTDDLEVGHPGAAAETAGLIDRLDATVIAFSSVPPTAGEAAETLIFRYDLRDAIADGVLSYPPTWMPVDVGGRWPDFDAQDPVHGERRVILNGVYDDRAAIRRLATELGAAGVRVAAEASDMLPEAAAGDVLVAVLSPNSVKTPLLDDYLTRSLERRGVDIVPAVIEFCAAPSSISSRFPVDVTAGVDGLLRRLQASAMLNVARLPAARFERLVADVMTRLGFSLSTPASSWSAGHGADLVATFQDPDRFGIATPYLVQVKQTQASLRDIRKLAGLVRDAGVPWRGMIVTRSQLTSVAETQLARLPDDGLDIQVVDGPRLRSLLLRYPDLIASYFHAG
jgi:transcriptional regulator with XRE-family HTH domain